MIDGLKNVMTPKIHEGESNDSVESVALAGAVAIQRLIADRDRLRDSADDRQRDLMALSAINEDLRRRIDLIRHHYVELGTRILTQLEQFDQATREAMQEIPYHPAPASSEDANLVALAHRLKPNNGSLRPANDGKPRER